ncbi:filamentous hemagglutinin family outer membrane protein [Calothrix parasitica NIES-267]|uniref:Filamentous hemagglutinin family outer membrane protein n=1 Tax=Calothrix parasitica NIES-267 TaxID=1973488 RepID=A0A1Z4LT40_9CYAN|nr:filamentous hemagglutinin family outer membrane protein [Calothrix parasitica NIES-267]
MKGIAFSLGFISSLLTLGIVLPGAAQVTSDNTTNTTIKLDSNKFNILNGIQKGNNLYHSFKEFSIPTGGEAIFNNSSDIVNIINRVTGGNISNIDGLIKANGNANLFLINPAGIVFGENARLDIGGSFLGSTAESILFEDGFEFSALNAQSDSLLTVSVPLGLQMGQNPGDINVRGTGHPLNRPAIVPIVGTAENMGLNVKADQTLALIAGDITLDGGILTAADGHLELGSVQDGEVSLKPSSQGWQFSYNSVQNFQDIRLLKQALVDASGLDGGSIQVRGNNIDLQDGSLVLLRNSGFLPSGNININAANNLTINGTIPDGSLASGVIGQVLGTGAGGTIFVQANQANLSDGGVILNETYSTAAGGNIIIDVANTLTLSGFSPLNLLSSSAITSTSFSDGDAGEIIASARNLILENGGVLSTTSFGKGNGGNLTVNATDSIEIIIDTPIFFFPSSITAESIVAGNAGNLEINTGKLSMSGGGSIFASTRSSGKAGDILINASESIEVSGGAQLPDTLFLPTLISSDAKPLPPDVQLLFGASSLPSGDSGSIKINTPILKIEKGAGITVGNAGTGKAGNLDIQAGTIYLDNQGQITAATESGGGGNISLQTQDLLLLRNSSLINTEAKGTGNGGNITINSPVIVGFENSDIIANAVEGNGGNIDITTQGIFGLEFRDELTEENDITASSQFGVKGTVAINNISIDPSSGLTELPAELKDSSQQISSGCSRNSDSTFVATGKGGIPQNPNERVDAKLTWSDVRDLSTFQQRNINSQVVTTSNKPAIVEATGFIRNRDGEIELVAAQPNPFIMKQVAECSRANT